MILGASFLATLNSAAIVFSASPTYLDVSDDAVTLNTVTPSPILLLALTSPASALTSRVLPLPGGPKRSRPDRGERRPEKSSGLQGCDG